MAVLARITRVVVVFCGPCFLLLRAHVFFAVVVALISFEQCAGVSQHLQSSHEQDLLARNGSTSRPNIGIVRYVFFLY